VTEQAVARKEQPDVCWQACKSPRFSHVHIEHIYYVSGPSRKASLRAAVEVVVRQLLDLVNARIHIAQVMTVRSAFLESFSACCFAPCLPNVPLWTLSYRSATIGRNPGHKLTRLLIDSLGAGGLKYRQM
jgi:hypothetical protein